MKQIRIPARTIEEQILSIEEVIIFPSQSGRVVMRAQDGEQFDHQLTDEQMNTLLQWMEGSVAKKYATAVLEDVPILKDVPLTSTISS